MFGLSKLFGINNNVVEVEEEVTSVNLRMSVEITPVYETPVTAAQIKEDSTLFYLIKTSTEMYNEMTRSKNGDFVWVTTETGEDFYRAFTEFADKMRKNGSGLGLQIYQ